MLFAVQVPGRSVGELEMSSRKLLETSDNNMMLNQAQEEPISPSRADLFRHTSGCQEPADQVL